MWTTAALLLGALLALLAATGAGKLADSQFDWGDVEPMEGGGLLPAATCAQVVAAYKSVPAVSTKPLREMPPALVDGYTMGGKVDVGEMFVDDTLGGKGSHYQYPAGDVQAMIDAAAGLVRCPRRRTTHTCWLTYTTPVHCRVCQAHLLAFGQGGGLGDVRGQRVLGWQGASRQVGLVPHVQVVVEPVAPPAPALPRTPIAFSPL